MTPNISMDGEVEIFPRGHREAGRQGFFSSFMGFVKRSGAVAQGLMARRGEPLKGLKGGGT